MKNKNAPAWIINSITWEIKAEKEFRTKHFVRLIETICSFVLRGHHIDETELLTSNTAGSKKRPSVACFSFDSCFFELINSCLQFAHISISQLSWCRNWTEEKCHQAPSSYQVLGLKMNWRLNLGGNETALIERVLLLTSNDFFSPNYYRIGSTFISPDLLLILVLQLVPAL